MTQKPCTHEYLANSKSGRVLICRDCGVVHLSVQNLSLRLDVEQFSDLAVMMTEASKRLNAEASQSKPSKPRLTVVH
jgi:hypothetical protein